MSKWWANVWGRVVAMVIFGVGYWVFKHAEEIWEFVRRIIEWVSK